MSLSVYLRIAFVYYCTFDTFTKMSILTILKNYFIKIKTELFCPYVCDRLIWALRATSLSLWSGTLKQETKSEYAFVWKTQNLGKGGVDQIRSTVRFLTSFIVYNVLGELSINHNPRQLLFKILCEHHLRKRFHLAFCKPFNLKIFFLRFFHQYAIAADLYRLWQ